MRADSSDAAGRPPDTAGSARVNDATATPAARSAESAALPRNPPAPTTAAARPRLLVIASTFPGRAGDGTPPFIRNLALQEARYFDTLVVVPRVPGAPRRETVGGMRIERFAYFPRRFEDVAHGAILENVRGRPSRLLQVPFLLLFEALAVARAVRRHRPDVVHVHWLIPQGVVALVAARRVPWMLTTLGGDLYALRGRAARWLKRRVVRRASVVTAMNVDMCRRIEELGAPADRVHVVPMGADIDRVRQCVVGVEPVPGRLLFAGRLVEKKGLAVLLDALERLTATAPDVQWQLQVVGDGPLRDQLAQRAARCGDRVTFRGSLTADGLSRAMGESQLVVLPSVPAASGDQDGLPVVLLEALAAGRAVVASRLPGIDEAVVDGESGLLVPAGDPGALASAIERVLGDPQLRDRLAAGAAARADGYSTDALAERYCALLLALAPQH